jgi:hypothetical protein
MFLRVSISPHHSFCGGLGREQPCVKKGDSVYCARVIYGINDEEYIVLL